MNDHLRPVHNPKPPRLLKRFVAGLLLYAVGLLAIALVTVLVRVVCAVVEFSWQLPALIGGLL